MQSIQSELSTAAATGTASSCERSFATFTVSSAITVAVEDQQNRDTANKAHVLDKEVAGARLDVEFTDEEAMLSVTVSR